MNRRKLTLALLAGLVLAVASPGFAAVLFEDDFSGSATTPNTSFGAWDAAGLSIFAGRVGSVDPTAVPSWRQDGSLGFVYDSFNQAYQWKTNAANSFVSDNFVIAADVLQASGGAESMKIIGFSHASNQDGFIDTTTGYFVDWYETPTGADYFFVDKYVDGVSQTTDLDVTNVITQGTRWLEFNEWNTFEIDVTVDAESGAVAFNIYMTPQDGVRTLAASVVDTGTGLDGAGMSLTAYSRNTDPNYTGATYVDSVLVNEIPEPATLGLLVIGCMGLIARKKRM